MWQNFFAVKFRQKRWGLPRRQPFISWDDTCNAITTRISLSCPHSCTPALPCCSLLDLLLCTAFDTCFCLQRDLWLPSALLFWCILRQWGWGTTTPTSHLLPAPSLQRSLFVHKCCAEGICPPCTSARLPGASMSVKCFRNVSKFLNVHHLLAFKTHIWRYKSQVAPCIFFLEIHSLVGFSCKRQWCGPELPVRSSAGSLSMVHGISPPYPSSPLGELGTVRKCIVCWPQIT